MQYFIPFKRRPYHIVIRDMASKRVLHRTRMRHYARSDAMGVFNRAARQLQCGGSFDGFQMNSTVRVELYQGPASARHSKYLIAMAGNFGPPKFEDCLGTLPHFEHGRDFDGDALNCEGEVPAYLELINAAHADHASLTKRWSDSFIVEKRPDTDPLKGKSVLELDPRNARFDGDVLNIMPEGKLTEEEYQARKAQLLVPMEWKEGPVRKRTNPIRMMSEAEGHPDFPLSDDVVKELMVMSEEPRSKPRRLMDFINHQLAPVGVRMTIADDDTIFEKNVEDKDIMDLIYSHYAKEHPELERAAFDAAYERWLAQRDRLVEIASDHVASNAGMWDKLKEGNVGFKPGQMVLLTAHRGKSMVGINVPTMDKIRHNCEDPKALQRRTMLVHADPILVPLFENGKQVFNEDGTPVMVIDEASQMYPTTVRLSEVVDPDIDIAATYPQNPKGSEGKDK